MEKINQIRILSLWIFILPILALNLCLFISINYDFFENTIFAVDQIGRTGFTIPYIDGSVSISRTARTYPAYLVFKPCMIITAILLIKYWISTNALVQNLSIESTEKKRFMLYGVLSAIFLIFHAIFLGIKFDSDLYKLFRKLILLLFIIFEICAQSFLVINLYKCLNKISYFINKKMLNFKALLVTTLVIVTIVCAPIVAQEGNVNFKHALEWDYFLGVIFFYFLTFLMWRKK